jgi:hypothetical protein
MVLRYPISIDLLKSLVINGCKTSVFVVSMYLQHWADASLVGYGASAFPQNPSGNPMLTAECIGAPWSAATADFRESEHPKS